MSVMMGSSQVLCRPGNLSTKLGLIWTVPGQESYWDRSRESTSIVSRELKGVLTPTILPSRVIEPFSCLISVFRPDSISWSIEDLFLDVIAKTLLNSCLGAGLRTIPFAWATALPSSITLDAVSRSSGVSSTSPFLTRVMAELGLVAEFTMALVHSTPLILLLITVEKPALRNILPIARHRSECLPFISPTQVVPFPV